MKYMSFEGNKIYDEKTPYKLLYNLFLK